MVRTLSLFLLTVIIFTSCARRSYYLSPVNGTVPSYRPMITAGDSIPSAFNLTGSIGIGTANNDHDNTFFFNSSISRSHVSKNIGYRYGVNLSAGTYKVGEVDTFLYNSTADEDYINRNAKKHATGSYGIDGGVHYIGKAGKVEFRVIGAEFSLHKEFGDYLKFRKNLPPAEETLVERSRFFGAAGLYTEVINSSENGQFGFKVGFGKGLKNTNTDSTHNNNLMIRSVGYEYVTVVFSFTKNKWTGFAQAIRSDKAMTIQFGGSFRLGRR